MADIASLGIEIRTEQVKSAMGDLDGLTSAAKRADIGTSALEASAKRLGITVDQYRQKISGFNAETEKLNASNTRAVQANNAVSASAVRMLGSYNGISLIMQGITAASSAYYLLTASNAPTIEKSLEEQARLIGLIKDAYRDATDKAGTFFNSSKAILKLQAELNINDLQTSIRGQIADVLKGSVGMTSEVDAMGNSLGTGTLNSSGLGPFKHAVDDLYASISLGSPAVEKFRNTIADIGNSDPTLKVAAGALLAASQAAGDTADKINAANRALRLLNGTATAADREGLGLSNRVKAPARDPFDTQVISINKHIAALKADADAVGGTVGDQARLRIEAQLLEAAQQKGAVATDAQKTRIAELGKAASDAAMDLERAKVSFAIKFDRDTIGLSAEDVQIAQQLRGLYPNVTDALNSTEAAQMRFNNQLREAHDISAGFANDLVGGLLRGQDAMKSMEQAAANLVQKLASSNLSRLMGGGSIFGSQSITSAQGALGVASAGVAGYQSGNAMTGTLGGAMAGATFGPVGAVIGGITGLVGGIFGAGSQSAKQLEEAKGVWEVTAPDFASFLKPAAPAVANDNSEKEKRGERLQYRRAA